MTFTKEWHKTHKHPRGMLGKIPWNKGKPWTSDVKEKISESKEGKKVPLLQNENHYLWKGNKVGYYALHTWVRNRLVKPYECEKCGKQTNKLDLSNKSELYRRNLNDWEWLCRSCHLKKDFNSEKNATLRKRRW